MDKGRTLYNLDKLTSQGDPVGSPFSVSKNHSSIVATSCGNSPKNHSDLDNYGTLSESSFSCLNISVKQGNQSINYKPPTRKEKIKLYGKKIKYMKFQRAVTEPISNGMCFCSTRTIREVTEGKDKVSGCEIALNQNGYRLSGIATCKSAWCVRCSTMKIGKRVNRIKQGIEHYFSQKKKVYFLTLTLKRSDNFHTQIIFLKQAWKRLINKFHYLKKKGHEIEFVKSFDITFKPYQENKFHPHLHICLVTDQDLKKDKILDCIKKAWLSMSSILDIYANDQGQLLEEINPWNYKKRATYLGKNSGLGFELGAQQLKKSRGKGLTLADVIDRASDGCEQSKQVYIKFLTIIKGKNTLNFSRNWPKLIEEEKEEDDYIIPITPEVIRVSRAFKIDLHNICISILNSGRARIDYKKVINDPLELPKWFYHYRVF